MKRFNLPANRFWPTQIPLLSKDLTTNFSSFFKSKIFCLFLSKIKKVLLFCLFRVNPLIFLFENLWPLIVNGIHLSALILIFLSFKIKTFMMGSLEAETVRFWGKQKIIMLIKQKIWVVLVIFDITLYEKQILKLP